MNFILLIVMSSAAFLPKTFTMTPMDNKENCEQALIEAKKIWQTVNDESKCIDLEKEAMKKELKDKLEKLK